MKDNFKGIVKKRCGLVALALIVSMTVSYTLPIVGLAAAPAVTIDETVYVNLDYYGKLSDISVVKECRLNGNTQFQDYGQYKSVVNMSNYATPVLTSDSVRWELKNIANNKPFYYQCYLKDNAISLPWSFDVSYKLDGVPKKAEELAGASGLVEIDIHAMPNKKAPNYYKNNMLLQVATVVNGEDTKSLEAPGAQLQSVGSFKGVVFMALPGEEKTFSIHIGTDSFESPGITMTMIPGTIEQLKKIKELKEAKDTVKNSVNAIYFAMNDLLDIMVSMGDGLSTLNSGLNNLENAANTISASRDTLSGNADQSLEDLTALTEQTAKMIPHLQQSQTFVNDISSDVQDLMDTVESTQKILDDFYDSAKKSKRALKDLQKMFNEIGSNQDEAEKLLDDLKTDAGGMKAYSEKLNATLSALQSGLAELENAEAGLGNALNSMDGTDPQIAATQISGNATIASVQAFCQITEGMIGELQTSVIPAAMQISSHLEDTVALGNEYLTIWDEHQDSADDLLEEMENTCKIAQKASGRMIDIIDDAVTLHNTLQSYKEEGISLLKDTEELNVRTTKSLENANIFLKSLKNLVDRCDDQMDTGTRNSLQGMTEVIEKSISGIGKVPTIRKANDTVKKTIDEQFDKIEKENYFLNLDVEIKPQSFTSGKNPSPTSIQVVLRTAEISVDDKNDNNMDLESEPVNIGVITRIGQIFKEIWSRVIGVFKVFAEP
ncbi:MAG: hypothetical protein AAGU27_16000 [Dehalobacterium sp.]